jgi:hypothetical protein
MSQQRRGIRRKILVVLMVLGAPLGAVAAVSAAELPHTTVSGFAVIPSGLVPTTCDADGDQGGRTADVATGVNAGPATADQPVTLNLTGCDGAFGSAITPDGSVALIATDDSFLDTLNLGANPTLGSQVSLSSLGGDPTVTGVALTSDGTQGIVAVGEGVVGLISGSGDTYSVPSTGETSLRYPGAVQGTSYYFNGTTISSGGNPLGLVVDGTNGVIGVINGLDTANPTWSGSITSLAGDLTSNQNWDDVGNGGMSFSPSTATQAVIPTADGVGVLNLSNPSAPTGTDVPVSGVSGLGGTTSAVVSPDGTHVVLGAGNQLFFLTGLATNSLSLVTTVSLPTGAEIDSLAYTASQNLVVDYTSGSNALAASVGVVTGTMTSTPSYSSSSDETVTGGAPPDINGMSVYPYEVAGAPVTTGTTTTTSTTAPTGTTTTTTGSGTGGNQEGYDMVGSDGGVFVFGSSTGYYGSLPGLNIHVNNIVGMEPGSTYQGYFLVGSDGGVFSFGNTTYEGSLPGLHIAVHNIVGIVPTTDDLGYFLVGSDGGVFSFGDSTYEGSLPGDHISANNIVGIAATADDKGYWVVSSTGNVYGFGDAPSLGSANGTGAPITGIAGDRTGGGYWIVNSVGDVVPFGDAKFFSDLPATGTHPSRGIVAIVPTPDNGGYWLFGSDGGLYNFGDAPNLGSLPGLNVHVTNVVGAVPTQ